MSKKKTLSVLSGMMLLLSAASAEPGAKSVSLNGWTCNQLGTGGLELASSDGPRLVVNPTWVMPGWDFQTAQNARCRCEVKNGRLTMTFEVDAQNGFETQDDLPMLIIVNGDGASYPEGKFRLDDWNTATFSMDCAYGYSSHFESDALRLRFYLDGDRNISFWNDPSTKVWNIRIPSVGETKKDGGVKYKGTLSIVVGDVDFTTPIDKAVAEQKKVQYRRVLVPPQETGFDPSGWLAVCDDPDASRDDFIGLERLMDLRSHLYSLADRLRHREEGDDVAGGLVSTAYAALNGMDADGAQSAIASLDARMKELESADGGRRPLSDFSPYSWIKSFTQWGYVRCPDGHAYFEPNPWNLLWEDGFRCNVDQDPRVVIAETVTGRNFRETRYLDSMSDVSFERDWVSTRWRFKSGKTVTFSLLTPVVDVDGVTELKLSGFSVAPDSLQYIDNQGLERWITLESTDEAQIVPEDVGRPWLRLNIPYGRGLLLLPEARPTGLSLSNGVLIVKFERQGYVGVLRPPANLYPGEYPEVAEFFARTSAACPTACHERIEGRKRTWRYSFRERSNAWGTEAYRIAPVPPLIAIAGLRCADEKTFLYPNKWGVMHYVEGSSAVCELPATAPREPKSFCGVNSSIWEPLESELDIVTNGYMGVRLLTTADKTVAESCQRFEEVLAAYRRYGVKVLMDAHNSVYDVWWQNGITASDDFVAMWDAFSKVGAKYKDVVVGYDLYNEPGVGAGSEEIWRQVCTCAARAILANHPEAKIYCPGLSDGNPNGMANLRPLDLDGARQVMTYHYYLPHSFTHQKSMTLDEGGDTCVFYPAWAYPTDWSAGNHFAGTTVDWYDKWSLGAMLLPAVEHYAKYGVSQHVGEFSVIGYADGRSPRSAADWTADAAELFDHVGASWHLWNGGFGLGNEYVRDWFFARMRGNAAVSSVIIR